MHLVIALLTQLATLGGAVGIPACPSVHIIVARGSTEPVGGGIIGELASIVQNQSLGIDAKALEYPALLNPYLASQTRGVATLTRHVHDFATRCPKSKMVLMGFSQGAHVIADVLCGASEEGFPVTMPQNETITDKIAAIVLMGDPSHLAHQPFDAGSSVGDGIFPRQNPAGCNTIEMKTISFCDHDDLFCDSGDDLEVHMAYVVKYGASAAGFILSLIGLA